MRTAKESPLSCQICGSTRTADLRPAIVVRPAVAEVILAETGHWDASGSICLADLQDYRHRYLKTLLEAEKGELTQIELEVLESLKQHETLAANTDLRFEAELTFGQRLADRIAAFGGSWTFILLFTIVLASWMFVNSFLLATHPVDPYPYILLNLVLSALAAVQAPVIMMSQNRQQERDRTNVAHDYQINLKAELEIRHLHQKIDHLISHQWQRMVEIQDVQMELINELRSHR